jgi:hypothetical protein
MAPIPTPGWELRNDRSLSVWLSQDDENRDASATDISLRVSNDGAAEPLTSAHALYDFVTAPGEPESIVLDASPANRSPVTLESSNGGFFSAVFALERSASCSRDLAFAPMRIRLHASAASSGRWNWENDYAALDRPARSGWYRTQRIQLLDPDGHIVFGWAPTASP